MTGWAQDVSDLAQSWDTASEAWILAVDKDETLQGGVNTAAERRVYLGAAFFGNLNSAGEAIFDRALDWINYADGDSRSDITIPISSFSARVKADNPSYLSVVIPDLENQAAAINARPNGELVIEMVYEIDGRDAFRWEIVRVDLEEIRTDEGPRSQSITLSGHKTNNYTPKNIELATANYRNVDEGWLRFRAAIDPLVKPGDTVTIDADTFVAGEVIFNANTSRQIMELVESTSSSSSSSSSPSSSSSSESSSSESSSSESSSSESSSSESSSSESSSSESSESSSSLSSSSFSSSSSSLSSSSHSSSSSQSFSQSSSSSSLSISSSSSSLSSSSLSSSSSNSCWDEEGNDGCTVLLIHSDANNGSKTFVDSAAGGNAPHTFDAPNGDPSHATAEKKFCNSGIHLDGNDTILLSDDADWDFGTGDFTIDFWMKTSQSAAHAVIICRYQGSPPWLISCNTGYIAVYNAAEGFNIGATYLVNDNSWHHVAVVRYGDTLKTFIDGQVELNVANWNPNIVAASQIGIGWDTGNPYYNGYLDEIRISKGTARWWSNFTPPTTPYDHTCSTSSSSSSSSSSA
jgi:hypothetical protein